MLKINSREQEDLAPDDRTAALSSAAAAQDVPLAVLAAAVGAAEAASRHRVRAVPASRIDELVSELARTAQDAT